MYVHSPTFLGNLMIPFPFLSVSHSQISMIHPEAVTSCNVDLENLISDTNRSIATLAITTLLKVLHTTVTIAGEQLTKQGFI